MFVKEIKILEILLEYIVFDILFFCLSLQINKLIFFLINFVQNTLNLILYVVLVLKLSNISFLKLLMNVIAIKKNIYRVEFGKLKSSFELSK